MIFASGRLASLSCRGYTRFCGRSRKNHNHGSERLQIITETRRNTTTYVAFRIASIILVYRVDDAACWVHFSVSKRSAGTRISGTNWINSLQTFDEKGANVWSVILFQMSFFPLFTTSETVYVS